MPPYAAIPSIVDSERSLAFYHNGSKTNCTDQIETDDESISSSSSVPCSEPLDQHSKTVSFSPKVLIRPIDNKEDLKRIVCVNDIWYQRSEYQAFRLECQNTVNQVAYFATLRDRNQSRIPPSCRALFECTACVDSFGELCLRGLEQFVSGSSHTKLQAAHAVQAVLKKQELQRCEGADDKKCLADLYLERSLSCQEEARQQGIRDHQDIMHMEWNESRIPRLISELAFVV